MCRQTAFLIKSGHFHKISPVSKKNFEIFFKLINALLDVDYSATPMLFDKTLFAILFFIEFVLHFL